MIAGAPAGLYARTLPVATRYAVLVRPARAIRHAKNAIIPASVNHVSA